MAEKETDTRQQTPDAAEPADPRLDEQTGTSQIHQPSSSMGSLFNMVSQWRPLRPLYRQQNDQEQSSTRQIDLPTSQSSVGSYSIPVSPKLDMVGKATDTKEITSDMREPSDPQLDRRQSQNLYRQQNDQEESSTSQTDLPTSRSSMGTYSIPVSPSLEMVGKATNTKEQTPDVREPSEPQLDRQPSQNLYQQQNDQEQFNTSQIERPTSQSSMGSYSVPVSPSLDVVGKATDTKEPTPEAQEQSRAQVDQRPSQNLYRQQKDQEQPGTSQIHQQSSQSSADKGAKLSLGGPVKRKDLPGRTHANITSVSKAKCRTKRQSKSIFKKKPTKKPTTKPTKTQKKPSVSRKRTRPRRSSLSNKSRSSLSSEDSGRRNSKRKCRRCGHTCCKRY